MNITYYYKSSEVSSVRSPPLIFPPTRNPRSRSFRKISIAKSIWRTKSEGLKFDNAFSMLSIKYSLTKEHLWVLNV